MLFVSTRGKTDLVCSAHAITRGLADDGGLFVPQKFPELSLGEIVSMRSMTYKERAVAILSLFLTDYTKEELLNVPMLLIRRLNSALNLCLCVR